MARQGRFEPDPRGIGEVMRSGQVRRALRQVADAIEPRAKTLARAEVSEDFAEAIYVEEDTRPRGRPTARVIADRADAEALEFGDTAQERRRILGRAAQVGPILQDGG
jgi:acyl-CoA reductase-like NAD-dependent aldehyde dehydrogenase